MSQATSAKADETHTDALAQPAVAHAKASIANDRDRPSPAEPHETHIDALAHPVDAVDRDRARLTGSDEAQIASADALLQPAEEHVKASIASDRDRASPAEAHETHIDALAQPADAIDRDRARLAGSDAQIDRDRVSLGAWNDALAYPAEAHAKASIASDRDRVSLAASAQAHQTPIDALAQPADWIDRDCASLAGTRGVESTIRTGRTVRMTGVRRKWTST